MIGKIDLAAVSSNDHPPGLLRARPRKVTCPSVKSNGATAKKKRWEKRREGEKVSTSMVVIAACTTPVRAAITYRPNNCPAGL